MKVHRRDLLRASLVSIGAASGHSFAADRDPETAFKGRLAYSAEPWTHRGQPLAKALSVISTAGCEGVEIGVNALWEYREQPDRLKHLLDQHKLELAAAVFSSDFFAEEGRLGNISKVVQTARLVEAMGGRTLVLQHDGVSGPRSPREFQRVSGHLAEVGALVLEETGLRCAYEFRERDAADIRKIVATSDSYYVKFSFDVDELRRLGVRLASMVHTYRDRLAHLSFTGSGEVHETLRSLAEIGYSDWLTVTPDNISFEKLRTELAALKQTAAEIRVKPQARVSYPSPAGRGNPVTALPPRDPGFLPFFFAADEFRDVSALVETILPQTETPGALEARADEHADLMIWLDEERHDESRAQVEGFRRFCTERSGKNFAELANSRAVELLNVLAKRPQEKTRLAAQFFNRIRTLTLQAYYDSPQGLIDELGYQGNDYMKQFEGCMDQEAEA